MRTIPVIEVKSIDSQNSEKDCCPFGTEGKYCITNRCMAWYWTHDDSGCCALIYRPEHIDLEDDK